MREGKHFRKKKRQVDRNFILAVIQTIIAFITLIITIMKK